MSFAHEWNGWETVEEIGQGSFGVVYKIERDLFGNKEDAALKVLSIPDPRQLEEWRDEGYDEDSITERINCDVEKIVKEYAIMKTLSGNTNIVNCSEIDVRQKNQVKAMMSISKWNSSLHSRSTSERMPSPKKWL